MPRTRIKRNDLVRIGRNRKVYRVEVSTTDRDGKQKFYLWMLGWLAGWVCDLVDAGVITRNDALRIIGNGVCVQQAVAALRWLLSVSEVAA